MQYFVASLMEALSGFFSFIHLLSSFCPVVVVVSYPTPSEGWEDHGAPEAGQLSRVWTRGRKEAESRQKASGCSR